jgi:hypothetical protein
MWRTNLGFGLEFLASDVQVDLLSAEAQRMSFNVGRTGGGEGGVPHAHDILVEPDSGIEILNRQDQVIYRPVRTGRRQDGGKTV